MPLAAQGQELDPRAYSPSPVGTRLVGLVLGNSQGDVALDPSSALSDVDADVNSATFVAGSVFALGGHQAGHRDRTALCLG